MENVGMLVHRGLREVLGSLAEIGYNAEWQDIRASDMGAPHRRERIWIVAYPGHAESPRWDETTERLQYRERRTAWSEFASCREIPDTISKHDDHSGHGASEICRERSEAAKISGRIPDATMQRLEREKPAGEPREYKRLLAECDRGDWATEPAVGRLATGVSGRVDRLKGLGNAIVPQIAELLFNQIKNYNSHRTCETERASNGI